MAYYLSVFTVNISHGLMVIVFTFNTDYTSRIKSILKKRPSAAVGSTDDELEAVTSTAAVDDNAAVDLVSVPPMPPPDHSGTELIGFSLQHNFFS